MTQGFKVNHMYLRALIIILETDGVITVHIFLGQYNCYCGNVTGAIYNVIILLFSSQKSIKLQKKTPYFLVGCLFVTPNIIS